MLYTHIDMWIYVDENALGDMYQENLKDMRSIYNQYRHSPIKTREGEDCSIGYISYIFLEIMEMLLNEGSWYWSLDWRLIYVQQVEESVQPCEPRAVKTIKFKLSRIGKTIRVLQLNFFLK